MGNASVSLSLFAPIFSQGGMPVEFSSFSDCNQVCIVSQPKLHVLARVLSQEATLLCSIYLYPICISLPAYQSAYLSTYLSHIYLHIYHISIYIYIYISIAYFSRSHIFSRCATWWPTTRCTGVCNRKERSWARPPRNWMPWTSAFKPSGRRWPNWTRKIRNSLKPSSKPCKIKTSKYKEKEQKKKKNRKGKKAGRGQN